MLASRAASKAAPVSIPADLLMECIWLDIPLNELEMTCLGYSETDCDLDHARRIASTRSAARSPERTDPSMVAGNPVSVQSPARNRFLRAVEAPGRRAFCSGVASNVARRSRTICQGGSSPVTPPALQISRQIAW